MSDLSLICSGSVSKIDERSSSPRRYGNSDLIFSTKFVELAVMVSCRLGNVGFITGGVKGSPPSEASVLGDSTGLGGRNNEF